MPALTDEIRVFIADDDERLVKDLTEHINSMSTGIRVTGSVSDGQALWDQAGSLDQIADVVVTDIGMPKMDGLRVVGEIKKLHGDKIKVLVITGLYGRNYPAESIRRHADGFVAKIRGMADIVQAIQDLCNGKTVYMPDPNDPAQPPQAPLPPPVFTPIEKRVLDMIIEGMAAKEIAAKLNKSQPLVEKYWRNIAVKFGTNKVAVIVRLAVEYGLHYGEA